MRIGDDKEKIISMKADIILHNVYFNSFGKRNECSKLLVQQYKSIQSFLYELYKASLDHDGFCVIYSDGERIKFSFGEALIYKIGKIQPLLAIDLREHAYFLDYGFNKEELNKIYQEASKSNEATVQMSAKIAMDENNKYYIIILTD